MPEITIDPGRPPAFVRGGVFERQRLDAEIVDLGTGRLVPAGVTGHPVRPGRRDHLRCHSGLELMRLGGKRMSHI